MDRIVEDRPLEGAQQILTEGQRQDLVGGERHVAQTKRIEETIVDPAVAFFAEHGEARILERIEIAVHGAAYAVELLGELVKPDARAAACEALDQEPLP